MEKRKYVLATVLAGLCLIGRAPVMADEAGAEETILHCQIARKVFDENTVFQSLFDDAPVEEKVLENGSITVEGGEGSLWMNDGSLSYEKNENALNVNFLIFQYIFPAVPDAELEPVQEQDENQIYTKISDICGLAEGEELRLVRAGNFDQQFLAQVQEKMKEYGQDAGIEVWDAEEYTAFEYEVYKGGIPVMGANEPRQGYFLEIWGADPVYVRALAGDGELLCLTIQGLFEVQDFEIVPILTKEEAVQIAENEMEEIVSDYIWEMTDAKLEYVPVPDWADTMAVPKELIPYWCLIGTKDNGEEAYEEAVRINAVTGGNLAYGE